MDDGSQANSLVATLRIVHSILHSIIKPTNRSLLHPYLCKDGYLNSLSLRHSACAMDRQRRPSLGLGISTATISTPRLKQSIPKQIDVPSFSSFQAQTPRVTDSPVRRKPLPATASPVLPQLSSGGAVVAVGEEESDGLPYNSAYLDDPPPTAHHVPWLPTLSTGSHTLLVRDLDQ